MYTEESGRYTEESGRRNNYNRKLWYGTILWCTQRSLVGGIIIIENFGMALFSGVHRGVW